MNSELLLLNRQILNFMNTYKSKSKIGIDCIPNRLHGELIDCMENIETNLFGSYNSEAIDTEADSEAIDTEADFGSESFSRARRHV